MDRIGILPIGQVDSEMLSRVQESLSTIFTEAKVAITTEALSIPREAFSTTRKQYRSDIMLATIRNYAEKQQDFEKVLGVADVDIFIPRLNFVFGQAECPGKAGLISLFRLRPEFYGKPPNSQVVIDRGTKEALHEIGHTLGLTHCENPYCVMYFSNSIFETDRKQSLFCHKCYLKTQPTVEKSGYDT